MFSHQVSSLETLRTIGALFKIVRLCAQATPSQATPSQATPSQATPAQAMPAQATPEKLKNVQATPKPKPTPTQYKYIYITCMNPFMFSHQVSSLETLGTISALVRPFASVHNTVVQGHFRPSNEARATLFTDKWSFPWVINSQF